MQRQFEAEGSDPSLAAQRAEHKLRSIAANPRLYAQLLNVAYDGSNAALGQILAAATAEATAKAMVVSALPAYQRVPVVADITQVLGKNLSWMNSNGPGKANTAAYTPTERAQYQALYNDIADLLADIHADLDKAIGFYQQDIDTGFQTRFRSSTLSFWDKRALEAEIAAAGTLKAAAIALKFSIPETPKGLAIDLVLAPTGLLALKKVAKYVTHLKKFDALMGTSLMSSFATRFNHVSESANTVITKIQNRIKVNLNFILWHSDPGHVIQKHIGLTDTGMLTRFREKTSPQTVSTFFDSDTASEAFDIAMQKNAARLQEFLSDPTITRLELSTPPFVQKVGRGLKKTNENGAEVFVAYDAHVAKFILKRDIATGKPYLETVLLFE